MYKSVPKKKHRMSEKVMHNLRLYDFDESCPVLNFNAKHHFLISPIIFYGKLFGAIIIKTWIFISLNICFDKIKTKYKKNDKKTLLIRNQNLVSCIILFSILQLNRFAIHEKYFSM